MVTVMTLVLYAGHFSARPPKESKLVQNFYDHQRAYERLRDMLLADKQLMVVASWGIETPNSGPAKPPIADFPITRYDEYLSLLKEIDAKGVSRGREQNPTVCVWVWASGWAADTRHRDVCWLDKEPNNQVASLDEFGRTPKPRKPVYKQISGNWYLWADW